MSVENRQSVLVTAAKTAGTDPNEIVRLAKLSEVKGSRRLLNIARLLQKNVITSNRKKMLKTYHNCFLGNEAIHWFWSAGIVQDEKGGVELGDSLLNAGYIQQAVASKQSEPFSASADAFYQFTALLDVSGEGLLAVSDHDLSDDPEIGKGNMSPVSTAGDPNRDHNNTEFIRTGYLHKLGTSGMKKWKPFYFSLSLQDASILYFDTHDEVFPRGFIPLNQIVFCELIKGTKKGRKFEIVSWSRMVQLKANSDTEATAWVRAVNNAVTLERKNATYIPMTYPPTPRTPPEMKASWLEVTHKPGSELSRLQKNFIAFVAGEPEHMIEHTTLYKEIVASHKTDEDVILTLLDIVLFPKAANSKFKDGRPDLPKDSALYQKTRLDTGESLRFTPPASPAASTHHLQAKDDNPSGGTHRKRNEVGFHSHSSISPTKTDEDRMRTIFLAISSPDFRSTNASAAKGKAPTGEVSLQSQDMRNRILERVLDCQLLLSDTLGLDDVLTERNGCALVWSILQTQTHTSKDVAAELSGLSLSPTHWHERFSYCCPACKCTMKDFADFMSLHASGKKLNLFINNSLLSVLITAPMAFLSDVPDPKTDRYNVLGKQVMNGGVWRAILMSLVRSDFNLRRHALKDVYSAIISSADNCFSLLALPSWQILLLPLLSDVPCDAELMEVYEDPGSGVPGAAVSEQLSLLQKVRSYVLNIFVDAHRVAFMSKHPDRREERIPSTGQLYKELPLDFFKQTFRVSVTLALTVDDEGNDFYHETPRMLVVSLVNSLTKKIQQKHIILTEDQWPDLAFIVHFVQRFIFLPRPKEHLLEEKHKGKDDDMVSASEYKYDIHPARVVGSDRTLIHTTLALLQHLGIYKENWTTFLTGEPQRELKERVMKDQNSVTFIQHTVDLNLAFEDLSPSTRKVLGELQGLVPFLADAIAFLAVMEWRLEGDLMTQHYRVKCVRSFLATKRQRDRVFRHQGVKKQYSELDQDKIKKIQTLAADRVRKKNEIEERIRTLADRMESGRARLKQPKKVVSTKEEEESEKRERVLRDLQTRKIDELIKRRLDRQKQAQHRDSHKGRYGSELLGMSGPLFSLDEHGLSLSNSTAAVPSPSPSSSSPALVQE